MDWVTALCLSVPFGAAAVVVAVEIRRSRSEVAQIMTEAGYAVEELRVGAARRSDESLPAPGSSLFEEWLRGDGRLKSEREQDMVEAAIDFVLGEDSGSEMGEYGTPKGARRLLDDHAPGLYERAVAERARREAAAN